MRKLYLLLNDEIAKINPEIYGHFTEHIGGVIYSGIWVGKDSKTENINGFRKYIIDKLKAINCPVIRWPGGCFAEMYNWRDGIGDFRPVRHSFWTKIDGRYESNEVGTHEFAEFCESVGTKPYFAANMTTTTPQEIFEWFDYCMSDEDTTTLAKERKENGRSKPYDIPYWGIGNENWGGGGNMTPEAYIDLYRKYSSVLKSMKFDTKLFACGSDADNFDWTMRFCEAYKDAYKCIDGYTMHYYCRCDGECIEYSDDDWYEQIKRAMYMDDIIKRNWNIISAYGMTDHLKLVVDEWGTWHKPDSGPSKGKNLYEQQSTMRDAMVTAITLNIFNNNCDKVIMANVAQLVNNLHCLFLADEENCITTPTYHIFDMFKEHQGAKAIRTLFETDDISYSFDNEEKSIKDLSISASVKDGYLILTAANTGLEKDITLLPEGVGGKLENTAEMTVLSCDDIRACNTFEEPEKIVPTKKTVDISKGITVEKSSIAAIKIKINDEK